MAKVKEITSREARSKWREILDEVMTGGSDIAITRYGKHVAVLIPAEDYASLADRLDDLRMGRVAERAYSDYLANRDSAVPYEDLREELLEDR
jgi:prevent-host-death family protein